MDTIIRKYELYSEFRNLVIYGTDLADAILRKGQLQRPDKFENGIRVVDGEELQIQSIVCSIDTTGKGRGADKCVSVLIETMANVSYGEKRQLISVDAKESELKTL